MAPKWSARTPKAPSPKPPRSDNGSAPYCWNRGLARSWTASMALPRPAAVYLIGAGPGDPELITVKGRRLLAKADAVLYDHLANPCLLDLAPAHAERVYVGKKRSAHEFSQPEISAMLIERARRGLMVVRLKGG